MEGEWLPGEWLHMTDLIKQIWPPCRHFHNKTQCKTVTPTPSQPDGRPAFSFLPRRRQLMKKILQQSLACVEMRRLLPDLYHVLCLWQNDLHVPSSALLLLSDPWHIDKHLVLIILILLITNCFTVQQIECFGYVSNHTQSQVSVSHVLLWLCYRETLQPIYSLKSCSNT